MEAVFDASDVVVNPYNLAVIVDAKGTGAFHAQRVSNFGEDELAVDLASDEAVLNAIFKINPDDLALVVNALAFGVVAQRIVQRGPLAIVVHEAVFSAAAVEVTADDLPIVVYAFGEGTYPTLCTRMHDLKVSFCEARSSVLRAKLGRLVGSMTLSTRWG
jgi:hypothetical protein